MHHKLTRLTSLLLLLLGIAMVVSTLVRGGGPLATGILVGIAFCLAGAGRLYVSGLTAPRRG